MFTQPRDPKTKNKPAHEKFARFVIEQIIPSQLVSKNNAMMKTKEMLMQDQNLLRNHVYNTFVLPQTTEQNDMILDIEVEVHHEMVITPKTTIHKINIALHLEIILVMTKILLLHNTADQDISIINETRNLIALLIDPPKNHPIDVTLVTDIDHAHTQETTKILQDTHLHLDHLQDLEILDILDLAHIRLREIKSIN